MLSNIAADCLLEFRDRFEDAPPNAPSGDDGEKAFDSIDPRARGWCKMKYPAGMISQPFEDFGVLVGSVVVSDCVNDPPWWDGSLHGIQELDELLVSMLGHAAADHCPIKDVEGGKQGGGAVPLVVVSHGPALTRLQRQARLGPVQRLYLALLVDGHDHGMSWWVHVQTHDVFDLGGEVRVLGLLEGTQAMRLEMMSPPDALDGAQADANGLGHHAAGPVSGFTGHRSTGQRQNLRDGLQRKRPLSRFARLVPQQTLHPCLGKALLPTPNRRPTDTGLPGNIENRQLFCRQKNDIGPLDMLLRAIAVGDDGGQARAVFGADKDVDSLCHGQRFARIAAFVNPLFGSVH